VKADCVLQSLEAAAYVIPGDEPESDGTLAWRKTTLVVAKALAGGQTGIGYTYAGNAAVLLIREVLAGAVIGQDAMAVGAAQAAMVAAVRNLGHSGLCCYAIAAVDNALWDLKAKLLKIPLCHVLGMEREAMPIYGSGGFTSYTDERLAEQLGGWVAQEIPRVKMKVGREPERDLHRARVARAAIGNAELFVDANSAYGRKQALEAIDRLAAECDIRWMEQPLAPEDREGMRYLRERAPARVEIADGEYGEQPSYFREMLESGAADVVMADATRCGISGFLAAGTLCAAWRMPLSSHCAPLQHLHAACAAKALRHGEYFHDHVRIESRLFEGLPEPRKGALHPDLGRPGAGFELKEADAAAYRQEI